MSRTIFGAALGLSLALACGCGSKSEPPPPNAKAETEAPSAGDPNANPPPKVDVPAGPAWEMDQSKHAIPSAPVRGRIAGADVTPEVGVEGDELTFRVLKGAPPTVERSVKLKLAPMLVAGQPVPPVQGREWKVKFDALAGPDVPEVWRDGAGKGLRLYPSGYALTLELGTRKGGKVPGKIYLSLGDDEKTVLAGTFEATYSRSRLERPGPDDAPYISGDVTVTGAKPDAEVRVTCTAFTAPGASSRELQIPFDPAPLEQARWTRDESDKLRAGTLVAGDGKGRPFRFEYVKLPPGRYLISAGVVGGPATWKWVDVPANGALTETLTLDATKTGGVEVSFPPDANGKVFLAPADAPDKPALDVGAFHEIAFRVVRRDADIVVGKAALKDLAPGKYEVRAGDLRGFVDVVAGKTAELALAPPKKP
ncbi:MAG: hypothetical protein J0I06_25415 [Planctomycetes bacterium]|nr:hypothetical protein [Planctomycetota bacterium]